MMKKFISLLCVLAMVIGIVSVCAVSASAEVDSAKTIVDVRKGQSVTYRLKLGEVESKVIGSDFSVYYDPAVLEVESVLDFNDNDQENWDGNWLANPNLDGEVLCNFSVIRGVKFDDPRSFITVKFKAKADAKTDISYFVRYLYDYKIFIEDLQKSKPQITQFKFTCDVTVDGDVVLEDAQPELNVDVQQDHGVFINTVTGDSNDADPEIAGTSVDKEKAVAARDSYNSVAFSPEEENTILYGDGSGSDSNGGGSGNNGGSGGSAQNSGGSGGQGGGQNSGNNTPAATAAPPATTAEGYYITATDAQGNVTATSDEAPAVATPTSTGSDKGGPSPVIWIVIVLVVLAGGGAAVYFYTKKKNTSDAPVSDKPDADKDSASEDKE